MDCGFARPRALITILQDIQIKKRDLGWVTSQSTLGHMYRLPPGSIGARPTTSSLPPAQIDFKFHWQKYFDPYFSRSLLETNFSSDQANARFLIRTLKLNEFTLLISFPWEHAERGRSRPNPQWLGFLWLEDRSVIWKMNQRKMKVLVLRNNPFYRWSEEKSNFRPRNKIFSFDILSIKDCFGEPRPSFSPGSPFKSLKDLPIKEIPTIEGWALIFLSLLWLAFKLSRLNLFSISLQNPTSTQARSSIQRGHNTKLRMT